MCLTATCNWDHCREHPTQAAAHNRFHQACHGVRTSSDAMLLSAIQKDLAGRMHPEALLQPQKLRWHYCLWLTKIASASQCSTPPTAAKAEAKFGMLGCTAENT
mmetsp:Transcript_36207/g.84913  ORF Transcript_36207/g.84913 Transcript_36207/m.84913 type:complete len:104 (+) Transcript_36207:1464-1775(+)